MKIVASGLVPELERSVDLTGCFDVRFGEGQETIIVSVSDGKVRVEAPHGQLIVRPRAGNVVWCSREPF